METTVEDEVQKITLYCYVESIVTWDDVTKRIERQE